MAKPYLNSFLITAIIGCISFIRSENKNMESDEEIMVTNIDNLSSKNWTDDFMFLQAYLIFAFLLESWELYLNLRQLKVYKKKNVPSDMIEFISKEEFEQSNLYSYDKMTFSIFSQIFRFILNNAQTLYFFYPFVWNYCGSLLLKQDQSLKELYTVDSFAEYKQSLIFTGFLMMISEIEKLPFSLYSDFVIEARHGFNKKTLNIFITDIIKSLILQCIFGSVIISALIWIVKTGGDTFYIWLWLFTVLFSFIMMAIYPNVIAPLFNKFEPLHDVVLKDKIEDLAKKLDFPLGKLYQIDGSKRTGHSNAYFYGFWWCKQIVLYDTLLHMPHDRILAILGHELGHWKLNHTIRMMFVSFTQSLIMFYCFGLCMYTKGMYTSFGYSFDPKPVIVGFSLFMTLLSPVTTVIGVMMTFVTRVHEFQADAFSHKLGYGVPLCEGLLDLHKENKSCLDPDPLYSWYHYSHPPLRERLHAIKALDKTQKKKE